MKRNARPIAPWGAEDRALHRVSIGLFVLAAVFLVYDVVALIRHGANFDQHIPFLFPVILACFGGFSRSILRRRKVSGYKNPPDGEYHRDSYLHPDNHPKGRRDAPDGTSD
jgi:hypothetical protein